MPDWTDRLRSFLGHHRELEARMAYLAQRRHDLAGGEDPPDPEALAQVDDAIAQARHDLTANRPERAANTINDLDERIAALEMEAAEAAETREAHAQRVQRLRRSLAGSRSRLVGLRLGGIGTDGLAMLEARLERAEHSTSPAAIAAAEAESAAIERAIDRLAERVQRHISSN